MKTIKTIFILAFFSLVYVSCSDDDTPPQPVNEEELITTMIVTLTEQPGGQQVTLVSQDLDGDGPEPPQVAVSGALQANGTYSGTVQILNETVSPSEDITEEVEEEAEEHQFFYVPTGAITGVTYTDQDSNGNPIGITFELTTGAPERATLAITLRHEPKKPNDGTLADAGGETDISQSFNITVQ